MDAPDSAGTMDVHARRVELLSSEGGLCDVLFQQNGTLNDLYELQKATADALFSKSRKHAGATAPIRLAFGVLTPPQ
jgi:hypothetical protein